jgi:hypothetical protein
LSGEIRLASPNPSKGHPAGILAEWRRPIRQGLEALLELGVKLHVVDTGSRRLLFHPKIYLARSKTVGHLVIGSANTGAGKSHLATALGLALVQNGRRVLFMRTTDLVQRLQLARRELGLEAAITKLDKYQLLILDDIAYVTKDQAETSVLFELIAARYERRSLLITANQPFGEWGKIFPDQAMTLAAIDRLVHHATILEMNVESYRRKAALKRKRGPAD